MRTRQETVREVEDGLAHGMTAEEITTALGVRAGSVARALDRAGRLDLAAPFWPLRERQDRRACADCGTSISRGASRCTACAPKHRTTNSHPGDRAA